MVGYPYYNDPVDNDKVYLSDIFCINSKLFWLGFAFALLTSPYVAFAEDSLTGLVNNTVPVPQPAPSIAGVTGNVPTVTRERVQAIVSVAACGAAVKNCGGYGMNVFETYVQKVATASPPTLVGGGVCILLTGYCLGKLSTKAIDKALGF